MAALRCLLVNIGFITRPAPGTVRSAAAVALYATWRKSLWL